MEYAVAVRQYFLVCFADRVISIVIDFLLCASGFGGTFSENLFPSICLQDCYIKLAITSAGSGSGSSLEHRISACGPVSAL